MSKTGGFAFGRQDNTSDTSPGFLNKLWLFVLCAIIVPALAGIAFGVGFSLLGGDTGFTDSQTYVDPALFFGTAGGILLGFPAGLVVAALFLTYAKKGWGVSFIPVLLLHGIVTTVWVAGFTIAVSDKTELVGTVLFAMAVAIYGLVFVALFFALKRLLGVGAFFVHE